MLPNSGVYYWGARQLSKVLEYTDFRNFLVVIAKAKEACENSGQHTSGHLVDFNEMVSIGSGAFRKMNSVKLSRYACYLIVQNADPSKEVVAQGQTYFAVQTRIQEIRQMDEFNRLSSDDEKRLFLYGTLWWIGCQGNSYEQEAKEKSANLGSYGRRTSIILSIGITHDYQ